MDDLNIWVIIAQLINFWLLFFIFKHFLWKKLVEAIKDRKEKLEKIAKIDEECRVKLDEANSEAEKVLLEAKNKSNDMMSQAEVLAKKKKTELIANAEKDAKGITDGALRNMEKEKLTMISTLKTKVMDLVVRLNSKVFDENTLNKAFVEKEIRMMK